MVIDEGVESLIGSPQTLLDRSGISRGSFYAFFETPDRVLDELALEVIVDSRDWVEERLFTRSRRSWTEIVDIVIDYYEVQFNRPLVRELWVGQHLTSNIRRLDRVWADEFAEILFAEFRLHAPQFGELTPKQCVVAVEVMERLGQYAFREETSGTGDAEAMSEARRIIESYFRSLA